MGPIFDDSPLFDLAKYEKTLLFHEFVHKGLTNFGCSELKLFTLNYHSPLCALLGLYYLSLL